MSIDLVAFFKKLYYFLTCYDLLETCEPSVWKEQYNWKLYPESFQLDFQWGKIIMVADFPQIYSRLLFEFHLPRFSLGYEKSM